MRRELSGTRAGLERTIVRENTSGRSCVAVSARTICSREHRDQGHSVHQLAPHSRSRSDRERPSSGARSRLAGGASHWSEMLGFFIGVIFLPEPLDEVFYDLRFCFSELRFLARRRCIDLLSQP